MRSVLVLVVLLSGCAVNVRPVSALLVSICATPVGILVVMRDGQQRYISPDDLEADATLRDQLSKLPDNNRGRLEFPICGLAQ